MYYMAEFSEASVLVVDDDPNFREILKTKLESVGFSLSEAVNGKEGVDKVKKIKPDLVVMDVQMPEMNGVEALSKIKADPEISGIKVVFLTNYGEDDPANASIDDKFAKDIGAIGHIKKTEDLDKIVEKIKKILSKS